MEIKPKGEALGRDEQEPEEPLPDLALPGPLSGPPPTMTIPLAFMEQMMDLVLKVIESVISASSSLMKVDVRKGHVIKNLPPKPFGGDRDFERVARCLREMENLFRAMKVEDDHQVQIAAGLLSGDGLVWWSELIKDQVL